MLNKLMSAVPQVLNVLGQCQNEEELIQYTINACKTQNVPIEQTVNQIKGLIRLAGGMDNVKNMLISKGFKL